MRVLRGNIMARQWMGRASAAAAALLMAASAVEAQSGNLALRTNGSLMRSGDCLRLEAVAFDYVPGPFVPQVRYTFTEAVPGGDAPGSSAPRGRLTHVDRPAGPTVNGMDLRQSILLDDTFCFGQGTDAGRYDIEVHLMAPDSDSSIGLLRTCVLHDVGSGEGIDTDCGLRLRGVKRADSPDLLVFDGDFPGNGLYRAAVFRDHTIERVINAGVHQTGPHELVITAPGLWGAVATAVDLVLFDEATGNSTSLARLVIPAAR